ncbi:MAG TPA: M1 family aminopeptidase [Candidatus Cybelea sp.]|nr:M1 family aminopeptidase [Candidatus Cybelea sp.]
MKGILLALFVLAFAPRAYTNLPEGIPRQLARERAARALNVRYELSFDLVPEAPTTEGHERLRFVLRDLAPLLLDYRDGRLTAIRANGVPLRPTIDHGHLELPASALRKGENVLEIEFDSNIAPAGKPLTRFQDRDDGSEYIYTLFVPMDASMAFPCFDQPDIKGRFELSLTAPNDWTVISNMPVQQSSEIDRSRRRTLFGETRPISTYLVAFAAGPFQGIQEAPGLPVLYARKSQLPRAQAEAPEVERTAAEGIKYLSAYFAQPFPFAKYDMILIPGFAYGGMEHAGATFLREESVLFRTSPTQLDLLGRDILVLHELTHQWFGDLVTMRWFDDLWLKEGFAQYMAYQALAALKPDENIWKRFYETIKPAAYEIDSTDGTTPIYQDIPNLKDAKSAYGAIVYSKAPGVLKQLSFLVGAQDFRDGLRAYLKQHAFSNADWSDLVRALEQVSGKPLDHWADMWIRHRGMPEVDVAWSCSSDRLRHLSLAQHDVLGTSAVWPVSTQLLLGFPDGRESRVRMDLGTRTAEVPQVTEWRCPEFVFANEEDYAYGRFLLDKRSEQYVLAHISSVHDIFTRTLLWGSLWEAVRDAKLAPRDYLDLSARLLPEETDLSLVQMILSSSTTALERYVADQTRIELVPRFENMAAGRMLDSDTRDMRILWFRTLRSVAETPDGLAKLKSLLNGRLTVPGVQLRPLDRWTMVTTLVALGDPDAGAMFQAERKADPTGDGQKYAYVAEAARPDPQEKQKYFHDYLRNPARQEDWIEQSLRAFNYWNQSLLTQPYLRPALDALPEIKRDRRIFFLVDWLTAFIGGQQSPAADAEVHEYLRTAPLEPDLRLKILQAVDELDRTVKIRQKFPD